MENGKSKYEDKLSAFLDGQLPPEEMAEIAGELETNPELAAQLEQMRRLDELTANSLPEFDDAILAKLEQNIMDNLEEGDEKISIEPSPESSDRKIFPIWQKYLAIAASVAVIFLAGRMAWNDIVNPQSIMDSPSPSMRQMPTSVPKASDKIESGYLDVELLDEDVIEKDQASQPEAAAEEVLFNSQSFEPPVMAADEYDLGSDVKQETAKVSRRVEERKKVDLNKIATAAPIVRDEAVVGAAKKAEDNSSFNASGDIDIADQLEEEEVSEPKTILGDVLQKEVVDSEIDSDKSKKAAKGDAGLFEMDPSMSNVATTSNYSDILADSIVSIRGGRSGETEYAVDGLEIENMGDIVDVSLLPLDSLKDIYALYVIPLKSNRKQYITTSSIHTQIIGDTLANPMALLDSLAQLPGIDNDADEIESLYLKAKTHYHLYLVTHEREHFREALDARRHLEDVLSSQINLHPNDTRLTEYANDISKWKFSE